MVPPVCGPPNPLLRWQLHPERPIPSLLSYSTFDLLMCPTAHSLILLSRYWTLSDASCVLFPVGYTFMVWWEPKPSLWEGEEGEGREQGERRKEGEDEKVQIASCLLM